MSRWRQECRLPDGPVPWSVIGRGLLLALGVALVSAGAVVLAAVVVLWVLP